MLRFAALLPFLTVLAGCGGWGYSSSSSSDQRRPLEKAVQEGDVAEVKRLLASGADANDREGVYGSPLNAAAWRKDNVEIIRILLAAGANPNGRGEEDKRCWVSPLGSAASTGDLENTRALLDAGASIKPPSCSKLVVGWLNPPIVDLLRQHGLNLYAVDENDRNELHIALAFSAVPRLEGIEYLVRSGVSLNARDRWGKTPLAYWREPRDYEIHWFRTWLFERVVGEPIVQQERENRTKISTFLERSGASLAR